MAILFELLVRFLGKVFNDTSIPWYQNLFYLLVTLAIICGLIYGARKLYKKLKKAINLK